VGYDLGFLAELPTFAGGDYLSLLGGLPGGWFVSEGYTGEGIQWRYALRDSADPTVVSDELFYDFTYHGSRAVAQNSDTTGSGNLWLLRMDGTADSGYLCQLTQSGGALSASGGGTVTMPTGTTDTTVVRMVIGSHTTGGAVYETVAQVSAGTAVPVMGLSTSDGSTLWEFDSASLPDHTGETLTLLGTPAQSRALLLCPLHGFELYDDTGTLLDTLSAYDPDRGNLYGNYTIPAAVGNDTVVALEGFSGIAYVRRVTCSSDVLSYVWSTDVDTGWDTSEFAVAVAGDVAVLNRRNSTTGPGHVYTAPASTGVFTTTGTSSYFWQSLWAPVSGAGMAFAGDGVVAMHHYPLGAYDERTSMWAPSWTPDPSPTARRYLRQYQSPRATPQRLGRPSLRQRQTF